MDWLIEHKIPIGRWAEDGFNLLADNLEWFFDATKYGLNQAIEGLLWLLVTPPELAIVAAVALLAFLVRRKLSFAVFAALALLLIINQGYWQETMETVVLVIMSTAACMAIGVPVGVLAAHNPRFFDFLRPILDMMQTIPTFVYLIPAMVLFGLGMVPGLFATVIFALPAPIRLTQLGVSSTPTALLEAGNAFGATRRQLLWKVELPYALPQIMAGLTQTIMLALSMAVIAGLVGAPGLGQEIVRALNTYDIAMGFEVGLCIVLTAIVLDRFFYGREGGRG
ncbi:choline ABC transporter permease subunit [Rhodobacterales bacterium]|nr:choline ABC transporter permease subunit [Rhodobacterales bacterium]